MFNKKYLTLFIGKNSIEPGFVTTSREPVLEEFESIPYTLETLTDTLTQIRSFSHKTPRCILSEELVYVTSFTLPKTTTVDREHIIRIAEESIPENLKETPWDFQSLAYKTQISETATLVEVAIITSTFAKAFAPAIQASSLDFQLIVPESCALASSMSTLEGVSLIIEVRGATCLFVATESGMVWSTYVGQNLTATDAAKFITFISKNKGLILKRIVFSHCDEEFVASLQTLLTDQYEYLHQDISAAINTTLLPFAGKDEEILNIDISAKRQQST